jgi:predicted nucleic acid-binding protein
VLLDTSAIVEIFRSRADSARFKKITTGIGDEDVYISVVQITEIADWATREKAPPEKRIETVKEMARVVPLDEGICLDAATIRGSRRKVGRNDFGLMDGIILATARSIGQRVLTLDEDFTGEKDCVVIS